MCFTEGVLQAYFDGELPAADRAHVAAHVTACERCRELAASVEQRRARVTAVFQDAVPAGHVAAALTRFRARVAEAEQARQRRFGWSLRTALAGGVLVAAGVALGIVLGLPRTPAPVAPRQIARTPAVESTAPVVIERPGPVPETTVAAAPSAAGTVAPAARRVAARPPATASRRTGVLPDADPYLLLTEDATRPEMGMVVRVRLPLSAITTIGELPPNARTSPEIEADVLVGQDGRARAIRFVSQTLTPGRK